MILIWKGAGILVVATWLLGMFLGNELVTTLFINPPESLKNLFRQWTAALLTLIMGLLVRLDKTVVVDPQSGEQYVFRGSHSLYFIPVIAWSGIFFVIGIVLYFRAWK